MYKQLPQDIKYPVLEHEVLDFWEKNNIFDKSLELRKDSKVFAFYEGPPTVNGKPGIHHMMARTIKDTICRYKTITGHFVRRQAGWDTHGLPVEIQVEKNLGLSNKSDIIEYGIDKFNEECKKFVYHNIGMNQGWKELTNRMGYWLDLDTAYITCTNNYVESVWWALKQYFDKGLIYKGFKIIPMSPTIGTSLSSHELSLGYKDVRDPNVYLMLKVTSSKIEELIDAHLMVWTTTPWTLFANVALAAGSDIDYVLVKNTKKAKEDVLENKLILAKSRLSVLEGEYEILKEFKGSELAGTTYDQILPYCEIDKEKHPNALSVCLGDFVSTEDGSGIVHLAPAFGEDDYEMSKKFNLPFLQPVTIHGHFTPELKEWAGRAIKTFTYSDRTEEGADKDIIIALKIAGKIYKSSMDYLHSYPHCWRTGNPIMYYASESWFIKSPEYKDKMIELNNQINWQPPEIGAGRFGNWLEEVKDWNLSRDRFWGSPIPIWITEDHKEMFAIGSIEELKKGYYLNSDGTKTPVSEMEEQIDLHRPFVDNIYFEKDGKTYKRINEVVDVWFDSGAMPFAQLHYPFENQELFDQIFPADFIAEGIDQTRGWFYTLHNIASAIFEKPAFKNIVVNELILDKDGVKMSKSKGNVIDPFEIMERLGADAVRWYLYVNNPPWKATLFNEKDIEKTIISDFFRSLTASFTFFALYANIDKFNNEIPKIPVNERPIIDQWIISRANSLLEYFRNEMENYELTKAHRAIQNFAINELSNWYIRRNRRRFWKGELDNDKIAAYQTLREVLMLVLSITGPTAPFLAENLYQRLKSETDPISIHLIDLPNAEHTLINKDLEEKMDLAKTIVSLALSLRVRSNIKVRQPLSKILIPVLNPQQRRNIQYFEDIIKEELNIKHIEYVAADTDIVKKQAKPNFKTLGKKYGKNTQQVANAIKGLKNEQIRTLELNRILSILIGDEKIEISIEDIEIQSDDIEGWLVATDEGITVALDTQLTEELINEGNAREFVNRIQNIRKDNGFEVTDRITIYYNSSENFENSISKMKDYIKIETLAEEIIKNELNEISEIDINSEKVKIQLKKV